MKKTTYKILAIVFAVFSISAVSEINRILTSSAEDIASQRTGLLIVITGITALIVGLTIYFWRKSK